MTNNTSPVIIKQTFPSSNQTLWNAITEHHQMTYWFFDNIPSFKAEVGFKTEFVVENEGRVFPHLWKIIEVKNYKKIVYSWKYRGYEGDSTVAFELSESDDQTELTLTHTVLEEFPKDIPEFRRESCKGGWIYFIKERLVDYLKDAD